MTDSKQEVQIVQFILAITNAATEFSNETCYPDRIMTDSEVGIINAYSAYLLF